MATDPIKISQLNTIPTVDGANDVLPIVDISTGITRKVTPNALPVSTSTQAALDAKAPTASPTLTGTIGLDVVQWDTTPSGSADASGKMAWNDTEKTLDLNINGIVVLQVGQEMLMRCRNNTGSTITNGSVVYVSGATGNRPTIALADADLVAASKTIGLVTEDIANNSEGFVTINGKVNGVNTSGFTAGDTLYLSSTAGAFTNVAPAKPARQVVLGTCTVSNASTGVINVSVNNTPTIDELSNVDTTGIASGDLLQWNGTKFVKVTTIPIANGGTASSTASAARTALGAAPIASPVFTGTVGLPAAYNAVSTLTASANVQVNCALGNAFNFTPNQNCNLTATGMADGQDTTIRIITSGTTSYTITFSTGIATSTSTLATGTVSGKVFILKYHCGSTSMYEYARTSAL